MPTHSTYYVLDFDRCLANTDKLHALLETIVAERISSMRNELEHARTMTEQSGGSFDTVSFVKTRLGQRGQSNLWAAIADEFAHRAAITDMFEPGAKEFINALDSINIPYGILTFGGETWQRMKLHATGLQNVPHIITNSKEKGRLIATWKQTDGTFLLPDEFAVGTMKVADSLVLVDDKAISFVGIPSGVDGIQVLPWNSHQPLTTQEGTIHNRVQQTVGLKGARDLLYLSNSK